MTNWNIDPTIVAVGGNLGRGLRGLYDDYENRQSLSELGSDIQRKDYAAAAQRAFQAGNPTLGLELLKYGDTQSADAGAYKDMGSLGNLSLSGLGGGAQAPASPASSAPGQPMQLPGGRGAPAPANLLPGFAQAGTRYSISPEYLSRTADLESKFNPRAHNPSGASGLFQFMPPTAKQYGLSNPYDPAASTDAAAHLAADNKRILVASLGRMPTNAELYLAHQQGGSGAAKLLANPDARAADIVGLKAVVQNGGRPDMTARQFAGMWLNKFGGAPASFGQSADASGRVPFPSGAGRDPVSGQRVAIQPGGALAGGAPAAPEPQQQPSQQDAILGQLNTLYGILGRPNLSPQARAAVQARITMAEHILTRADKQDEIARHDRELPAAAKEYEYAKRNGFAGSFQDFKQLSRQQTNVNIDQKGDTAFATETSKGIAKRFQDLSDEGQSARSDMALVSQLNDIGQAIDTGSWTAVRGTLANHGIKIGDNIGKVEAYTAIVDRMTPAQRVPGTGATSDFEMRTFKSALPSLIRSAEGNSIVMATLAGLAQQKIDRATIAERAQIGEISYQQAVKEMQNLASPFESFKKYQKGEFAPKTSAAPQQSGLKPASPQELELARQAISAGAPKEQVLKMMRERGFDPSRL